MQWIIESELSDQKMNTARADGYMCDRITLASLHIRLVHTQYIPPPGLPDLHSARELREAIEWPQKGNDVERGTCQRVACPI